MAYTELTAKSSIEKLKDEARRLGVFSFLHNGYEVPMRDRTVNAANKASLYYAIVRKCEEINSDQAQTTQQSVTTVEPVKELEKTVEATGKAVTEEPEQVEIMVETTQTEAVQDVTDAYIEETTEPEQEDREIELNRVANKIYTALEDIVYAGALGDGTAFDKACTLPANCISWIKELADSDSIDMILRVRSELFTLVGNRIEKITHNAESWQRWYSRIRSAVYNSEEFARLAKSRAIRQKGSLQMRTAAKMELNPTKAYDWAIGIVNDVWTLPKKDSYKVVAALIILTGRRPQEITSSAIFEASDIEGCVRFHGQLKRHRDELVEAFDIPVIGCKTQEVIEALFWLDTHGRRIKPASRSYEDLQKAAKQAHSNYSRYISAVFKPVYGLLEVLKGDWTFKNAKGKDEDRREPSVFRKVYAQAFADAYHGFGDRDIIISEILGHSDNSGSYKPYDSDFRLVDLNPEYTAHNLEKLAKVAVNRVQGRGLAKYSLANDLKKSQEKVQH